MDIRYPCFLGSNTDWSICEFHSIGNFPSTCHGIEFEMIYMTIFDHVYQHDQCTAHEWLRERVWYLNESKSVSI